MEANRSGNVGSSSLRDMVFQCAIFQTSAAIESYIRLVLEGWLFELKNTGLTASVPGTIKARFADVRLREKFNNAIYSGDESVIFPIVTSELDLWAFMADASFPRYFSGSLLHDKSSYPSWKNIVRVLKRAGILNPKASINAMLKADGETYVEAFQSVRTAIAHSSPPQIQVADVKTRLDEMAKLVGAIDRILHKHVVKHGGAVCWK